MESTFLVLHIAVFLERKVLDSFSRPWGLCFDESVGSADGGGGVLYNQALAGVLAQGRSFFRFFFCFFLCYN